MNEFFAFFICDMIIIRMTTNNTYFVKEAMKMTSAASFVCLFAFDIDFMLI